MSAGRRKLIAAASALGLALCVATQAVGAPAQPAAKQRHGAPASSSGASRLHHRHGDQAKLAFLDKPGDRFDRAVAIARRQAARAEARSAESNREAGSAGLEPVSAEGFPTPEAAGASSATLRAIKAWSPVATPPRSRQTGPTTANTSSTTAPGPQSAGRVTRPPPRRPSRIIAPRCCMRAVARAPGRRAVEGSHPSAAPGALSPPSSSADLPGSGRKPVCARSRSSPDAGDVQALETGAVAGARDWVGGGLAVAIALLCAVWVISTVAPPDPTPLAIPGITESPTAASVLPILFGNSLVLALHGFACVAGFIAGSSLPLAAERRTGVSRWIHEKARPVAFAWVIAVTCFSLATQAYALGSTGATLAYQLDISPAVADADGAAPCACRADRPVPAACGVDDRQPARQSGAICWPPRWRPSPSRFPRWCSRRSGRFTSGRRSSRRCRRS